MLQEILGSALTFIMGIITAYFVHWLTNKDKPKLVTKTFTNIKNNSQVEDLFENNIRKFLSLDQTFLFEPDIPEEANYSRSHSSGQKGYFKYLKEKNIDNYCFKFWDKTNKERWIEVKRHVDKLNIETHLSSYDRRRIFNILKCNL
jgi:hypothetical protein